MNTVGEQLKLVGEIEENPRTLTRSQRKDISTIETAGGEVAYHLKFLGSPAHGKTQVALISYPLNFPKELTDNRGFVLSRHDYNFIREKDIHPDNDPILEAILRNGESKDKGFIRAYNPDKLIKVYESVKGSK